MCRVPTLIHLNLSNCNLNDTMFQSILVYILKSTTIQALHLCNNPGVPELEYLPQFCKSLGIFEDSQNENKKEGDQDTIHKEFEIDEIEMIHGKIRENMMKGMKRIGLIKNSKDTKKKKIGGTFLQDIKLPKEQLSAGAKQLIQARKIVQERNTHTSHYHVSDPFTRKIFLLQRNIGYNNQLVVPMLRKDQFLKKPTQWNLITTPEKQCFVCQMHIYSICFWNSKIGEKQNLLIKDKDKVLNRI